FSCKWPASWAPYVHRGVTCQLSSLASASSHWPCLPCRALCSPCDVPFPNQISSLITPQVGNPPFHSSYANLLRALDTLRSAHLRRCRANKPQTAMLIAASRHNTSSFPFR